MSDAETSQDHADEPGSPEAHRDDYEEEDEQVPASLDTSAEENSAVENGVGGGDHDNYVEQDAAENEDSDVEGTFTAQVAATVEETEDGSNTGIAVEEQPEATADDDNGEDEEDRTSVNGSTEPPEDTNEGIRI